MSRWRVIHCFRRGRLNGFAAPLPCIARGNGYASRSNFPVPQGFLVLFEIQCYRVHAIAFAGRLWAVGKNVAQMCIAAGAANFSAQHSVAGVGKTDGGASYGLFPEAGPAAPGVELGAGMEQECATANAVVIALGFQSVVFPGKRRLGASFTGDPVLLGAELRVPLGGTLFAG